ncbi:hypothetical protein Cmtc_18690 [Cupriavidus sp. TKC]|uniref:hypothetical protein n=1 Tax=Cupriavidus sp. TKC TaxID=2880159 RepID=UPI0025A8E938|nr:hypothetical protein [Cupriavidus sp. TKC]GMG90649.1 hypothetical protein Cmtc_18690 [Cupriavidus sp. TKC]
MATNDFLVFGGGAGANVITQVTYSGLAARTAGFSSGVAQSNQLNKVWRQSSIMSAVLAQFISDISGQDCVDDGTTTTLLANLKAAVSAQAPSIVGASRNARMSVAAASSTATFAADEIALEDTLGGRTYRLSNFSKVVNLATTGAGGMDTGSAPTSGFVALYAIYNPVTGASALLARNATSAAQPEVYGGANMPAGYTASALISVWPTTSGGQFIIGVQQERRVSFGFTTVLSTSVQQASATALNIAAAAPANAKAVKGYCVITSSASTANLFFTVSGSGAALGLGGMQGSITTSAVSAGLSSPFNDVPIVTTQTVYYTATSSAGTMGFSMVLSGYVF